MGTTCSHKPANVKATDFIVDNHLTWDSHDKESGDKHTVLATALVGMREFYAAVEHVKADGTRVDGRERSYGRLTQQQGVLT